MPGKHQLSRRPTDERGAAYLGQLLLCQMLARMAPHQRAGRRSLSTLRLFVHGLGQLIALKRQSDDQHNLVPGDSDRYHPGVPSARVVGLA